MKKLIVGMLAALSVLSLWAETIGWYRFEEFERGGEAVRWDGDRQFDFRRTFGDIEGLRYVR